MLQGCRLEEYQLPCLLLHLVLLLPLFFLPRFIFFSLNSLFLKHSLQGSRPIHNRLREKRCMTHLYYRTSLFGIRHLFEVSVCDKDLLNDELFSLGLDVVTNIIRVFSEDEGAGLSELEEYTTKREGETSEASPEHTDIGGIFRLENLDYQPC